LDSTKTNGKWSGLIPGVSEFDPLFFEISPREAELMDPRQRHLLQESWKALEDAGYGANDLERQKVGMFVGVEEGDYWQLAQEGGITSNHSGILAARLAYFLNLHGPTMAINTACSSSLVAAHQALQSLRSGDCDTAIVAGVNLMLTPTGFVGMGQAGMLSPDGKCFVFDQRANGMVPGEAVAVVVLKRLSQAESDKDPIHAIIRASGVNYDGRTNGITAPSGVAQAELLKSVYDLSGIQPDAIDYVVTHGTGTKLGDPVEMNALSEVFKEYTTKQGFCAVTSTKSNLGHTFAASGLVSMISLVESIKNGVIPPSLHCDRENDYIQWKDSPFYVNKVPKLWSKRSGSERLGAVSAFGMSGTNAHMLIEGYCSPSNRPADPLPCYILPLSAKTSEALKNRVADMLEALDGGKIHEADISSLAYTLQEGRHHFSYRAVIVIESLEHAKDLWGAFMRGEMRPNSVSGQVTREFVSKKPIERVVKDLTAESRSLKQKPLEYQDSITALADFYCQGYQLDWRLLYSDVMPQKIALPTYPFVREQYWVRTDCEEGLCSSSRTGERVSPEPGTSPELVNNSRELKSQAPVIRYPNILPSALSRDVTFSKNELDELIASHQSLAGELDEILCRLLWASLKSMGLFSENVFTFSLLQSRGIVDSKYDRWLEDFLTILHEKHYLELDADQYTILIDIRPDLDELWRQWDTKKADWSRGPNQGAMLTLVESCLRALPEILTGKLSAEEIMFPSSSIE
ncbi:MAG: hypothetical protein HOI66_23465, partial [Verrucomicrobia bacterium]|nr:hypothetical protein [Verrucomicrobiota bacterium]